MTAGVEEIFGKLNRYDIDFADVRGQEFAKRALAVAASGGHNVLLLGPPGTGKSMLAARLATILPPLTEAESLETTRVYSATGRLPSDEPLLTRRPFRTPHHTISDAGMVGGCTSRCQRCPFRNSPLPSMAPPARRCGSK
jgi:magnesium chelatase family protein